MENPIKNFICISNYFKGNDFLINLKKQGVQIAWTPVYFSENNQCFI